LRNPGISTALRALFDRVWQTGVPWGACQHANREGITEHERALLRLLSQGDTDEQAGRKLGVSTRTVGRIAADLMTGLGASSRFQAGALAVTRGWLQPDFIALSSKKSHKDQISHTASVDANSAADALGRPRSGLKHGSCAGTGHHRYAVFAGPTAACMPGKCAMVKVVIPGATGQVLDRLHTARLITRLSAVIWSRHCLRRV
jgi:DNA-binding CsgD family transcriptional regulator